MKVPFALASLVLCLTSLEYAQTRDTAKSTIFIAPDVARSVTVSKAGVLVASLLVPKGTILSVSYEAARGSLPPDGKRFEFTGDVDVRAATNSQRPAGPLADSLNLAPLTLSGRGVEVVITEQP